LSNDPRYLRNGSWPNNGGVEGVNGLIQAAKARARAWGYGTVRHLITMTCLVAGKPDHLPAPPFISRCCGQRRYLENGNELLLPARSEWEPLSASHFFQHLLWVYLL